MAPIDLPDRRLGTQVWFERDDPADAVERLVAQAADIGFGQIRVFLMWNWIQAESRDEWDFALWDRVFEAAAGHGIGVKATLTANSGPWWLGVPSVQHSHTLTLDEDWSPAMEQYVHTCVARYAGHPALAQWILWNEPNYPFDAVRPKATRPAGARAAWAGVLRERYDGDISLLNRRWRTGYRRFDEVPFAEDVPHPAHADSPWRSYAPLMDDSVLRSVLLEQDLERVAGWVRDVDATTPLCVNPSETLSNHATVGYRLAEMAHAVDVLGASFHAPWHFSFFSEPEDFGALVAAGVSLLATTPGGHGVEVTEFQTGNTFYAGRAPVGASPAQISAGYLAPLVAGAASVTGWCFNTRAQDFEAGEWGLLDDFDEPGPRAHAVSKVRDALARLDAALGRWSPAAVDAAVLTSEDSQRVQFAMSQVSRAPWARDADAAVRGGALIATELDRLGLTAGLSPVAGLAFGPDRRLLVASHLAAWDDDLVDALLDRAARGATVLIDATTGQFDLDATLCIPWPGRWATATGMRSRGLETARDGRSFALDTDGGSPAEVVGVRGDVVADAPWAPDETVRFGHDFLPVLWSRPWGEGRLVYSATPLAPAVLDSPSSRSAAAMVLGRAIRHLPRPHRPLSPHTAAYHIRGERGEALAVFAPDCAARRGRPFAVSVEPGSYRDLWTQTPLSVSPSRVAALTSEDGIAILVRDH